MDLSQRIPIFPIKELNRIDKVEVDVPNRVRIVKGKRAFVSIWKGPLPEKCHECFGPFLNNLPLKRREMVVLDRGSRVVTVDTSVRR